MYTGERLAWQSESAQNSLLPMPKKKHRPPGSADCANPANTELNTARPTELTFDGQPFLSEC